MSTSIRELKRLMIEYMIKYKCQKCGCEFEINKKWIDYAETEDKYITCPLHGKHKNIHVISRREIEYLMQERKAVQL